MTSCDELSAEQVGTSPQLPAEPGKDTVSLGLVGLFLPLTLGGPSPNDAYFPTVLLCLPSVLSRWPFNCQCPRRTVDPHSKMAAPSATVLRVHSGTAFKATARETRAPRASKTHVQLHLRRRELQLPLRLLSEASVKLLAPQAFRSHFP